MSQKFKVSVDQKLCPYKRCVRSSLLSTCHFVFHALMVALVSFQLSVTSLVSGTVYYYASIRSLSLPRAFLGCFFDISSAIFPCGITVEQHYSKRK